MSGHEAHDPLDRPDAWDRNGFHHFAVYQGLPWCRCGINFNSFDDLDQHLHCVRAAVGVTGEAEK